MNREETIQKIEELIKRKNELESGDFIYNGRHLFINEQLSKAYASIDEIEKSKEFAIEADRIKKILNIN